MTESKNSNKKDPKDYIEKLQRHRLIAAKINRQLIPNILDGKNPLHRDFVLKNIPYNFGLIGQLGKSVPVIINENKEISVTDKEFVEAQITRFLFNELNETWHCNGKEITDIYNIWQKMTDPIPMEDIKPVAQLSEDSYCFTKLDFDFLRNTAQMPTFDEIGSRWDGWENFMKFVGSLFCQTEDYFYIWVYGEGGDSKSSIGELIAETFKDSFHACEGTDFESKDRFSLYPLIGKAVGIFPDENSSRFVNYSKFKKAVTGDSIAIEGKGIQKVSVNLIAKYLIFSNTKPNIKLDNFSKRRAIQVNTRPYEGEPIKKHELMKKLKDEYPIWLSKCYFLYKDDPVFRNREVQLNEQIKENYEWAYDFFDENYTISEDKSTWITRPMLNRALEREGYRNRRKDFVKWLKEEHGVYPESRTIARKSCVFMVNLAKKNSQGGTFQPNSYTGKFDF